MSTKVVIFANLQVICLLVYPMKNHKWIGNLKTEPYFRTHAQILPKPKLPKPPPKHNITKKLIRFQHAH